jgi:hypothetical protein
MAAGWLSFAVSVLSGASPASIVVVGGGNIVSTVLFVVLGASNPTVLAVALAIDVVIFLYDTISGGLEVADEEELGP